MYIDSQLFTIFSLLSFGYAPQKSHWSVNQAPPVPTWRDTNHLKLHFYIISITEFDFGFETPSFSDYLISKRKNNLFKIKKIEKIEEMGKMGKIEEIVNGRDWKEW